MLGTLGQSSSPCMLETSCSVDSVWVAWDSTRFARMSGVVPSMLNWSMVMSRVLAWVV